MEVAVKKSTKKTTAEQFGLLVLEMEKNPDLARGTPVFGASRARVDEKWSSISTKINAHGPPQRSCLEWRKIWADLKSRTKKKISENSKSMRETGGGPFRFNPLTEMEQTIDRILLISTAAQPRGVELGVVTAVQSQVQFSPITIDAAMVTPPRGAREIGIVTPTRVTSTPSTPTRATPSNFLQPQPMDRSENAAGNSRPLKRKRNLLEEQANLIRLEIKNQQATIEEMKKQNLIAQAQADALNILAESAKIQAEATKTIAEASTAHAEAAKKIAAAVEEVLGLLKNK